jgi:hypothetical protein
MKPFLDVLPDHRPAFCGREHHVNQATCVTVRHDYANSYFHSTLPRTVVLGYSQPSPSTSSGQALAGLFLALIVYPGLASWATFSRPFGTGRSSHTPHSNGRWAFSALQGGAPAYTGARTQNILYAWIGQNPIYLGACLASGLSFRA